MPLMLGLSPNVQTLIADLVQSVPHETVRAASVHTKMVAGKKYLYAREKIATTFRDRSLGPADDPAAIALAGDLRSAGKRARERSKLVTLIKRAGVPFPSKDMARLMSALSDAGLFAKGAVLVGTAAFQLYPCVVGALLSKGSLQTQDLDLAIATVAIRSEEPLLEILRVANPTFRALSGLDPRAFPKRFIADNGFAVEILTPVRSRADADSTPIRGLRASATPMQFLNYLIRDAMPAVALVGSGVPVTVPLPARYAVHKLIVAQRRQPGSLKRPKDLGQAMELIEALAMSEPNALEDALAEARARGPEWRRLVAASLKEIGWK
ncbi:MAG: hypothetical protein JO273_18835 [Methylobacteriaceae bacterium]|nr:hypothetical protein [Methylobacteriaceae bacterium]